MFKGILFCLVLGVGIVSSSVSGKSKSEFQPRPYIVYEADKKRPEILSYEAKSLTFPLGEEDRNDADALEQQFDQEGNCAGLAAPQIGIAKKIIVFAAPDSEELKRWRPDLTQTMPKTLWINPSYEGITEAGKTEDYEGCFSVKGLAGAVKRFSKIRYTAYDRQGNKISGIAEGFLARIIQHEVDHVQGELCIDKATPGTVMTIDEYRAKRAANMQ